jgi:general secretion pathway protein A
MYAQFYGLEALAFQLTPDPRFFFDSAEHRRAMAHLTYGLHNAEGFIVITGEVGAGKTMLVDRLLSKIDPMSFVATKLVTTQLQGDDLLRMVAAGFGIDHHGISKASLLNGIQEFVVSQLAAKRRALLIVDEAQNLSFEALEELRMLSNITVGNTIALQSFLVGQPQFRQVLGDRALDQLRQRITAAYHLGPLNEADTRGYVEHRLRCVGWGGDPHFDDECFSVIFKYSGGVPRRINGLCSRLLLFGFLEELHTISAISTEQVASDLRAELSAVAVSGLTGDLTILRDSLPVIPERTLPADLDQRLAHVERVTAKHHHSIKRIIEIMANYHRSSDTNE